MYWCVRGIGVGSYRSCIGVGGVSIMYWCGRDIDHVLVEGVCEGYRSCIGVWGIMYHVSIMYCVCDVLVYRSYRIIVCEGYRSCIGVGGVSIMYWWVRGIDRRGIMYWCVRGIDHVLVWKGYRSIMYVWCVYWCGIGV